MHAKLAIILGLLASPEFGDINPSKTEINALEVELRSRKPVTRNDWEFLAPILRHQVFQYSQQYRKPLIFGDVRRWRERQEWIERRRSAGLFVPRSRSSRETGLFDGFLSPEYRTQPGPPQTPSSDR